MTLPVFHVRHVMERWGEFRIRQGEAVDPVDDIQASLSLSLVARLVNAFDLQSLEEALLRCVVPRVETPAHRFRSQIGSSR